MKRAWIRRILPRCLVFLSACLISVAVFQIESRHSHTVPSKSVTDTTPAPVRTMVEAEDPEQFVDYEGDGTLFHQGYEVSKVVVTVPDDYGNSIDTAHVVVKRNRKTIAKFDGLSGPLGNDAEVGLFNLLGSKSEQLIISLTISRGGRHWIITLNPTFRVLFDSADYDVGREEFSIIDIDKDGVHEICLPIVSFYGLDGLNSVSETPLPQIIFKYDPKQMKYLPANHLFADYALRNLDPQTERDTYAKHHRFAVPLDYIYAGKEKEGWASFDKHYPSPDKEVMKSRIKAVLKDDPVYKYIYKNQQR